MGSSSTEETSGPAASVCHLTSFRPSLYNNSYHVFPSPQSHGATVSEDGLTGSRTAKSAWRRIRLESRGWLPVPRWTRWSAATGLRAAMEGPEAGLVHPGARVGALTLE